MWVVVETTRGSKFSVQLHRRDRVIDIKKKIEKSKGFAVSTQELYHNGKPLLEDDHDLNTCNIVKDSRLLLVLPEVPQATAPSNNPVVPQAPAPSNCITNTEDSLKKNQDSPAMVTSNKRQKLHQTEHSKVPPSNPVEVFFKTSSKEDQTKLSSLLSSCSIDDIDNYLKTREQEMRMRQGFLPTSTTEDIQELYANNQDLLQRESSNTFGEDRPSSIGDVINQNQVFETEQSLVPSNSTEESRIDTQDLLVRDDNQVVQTEKSPPFREAINSLDSLANVESFKKPPQKMIVSVLPYSHDKKPVSMFPVFVNASDKVKELRKEIRNELERTQRPTLLDLTQKGYFLKHKQRMLDDDQSFQWYDVADGDTIEMIPEHVTKGLPY